MSTPSILDFVSAPPQPPPATYATYTTEDGDNLDDICWRAYGTPLGTMEIVLLLNRALGPELLQAPLPGGLTIILPVLQGNVQPQIGKLW